MKKYIIANWKAHIAPKQSLEWLETFLRTYRPHDQVMVILAVPCMEFDRLREPLSRTSQVVLAAQTVSAYPPGNYTGALPAAWLKGVVSYVLLGHRERRHYFHESPSEVAAQVRECVANGLEPLVCIDRETMTAQLAALDTEDMAASMFAWMPDDAVRMEMGRDPEEIRTMAAELAGRTGNRPILYGGGVSRANARQILEIAGISGVVVGRSCVDPAEFGAIVASAV